MFCPECGKPNDDSAIFCYDCGTRLKAQNPEQAPGQVIQNGGNYPPVTDTVVPPPPKKPMNKKAVAIVGSVCGAFFALIIGLIVIISIFTPEKAAVNYVNALASGDYAKAYSYIYDTEKKYVSEEQYVEYMSVNSIITPGSVKKANCTDAIETIGYSFVNMATTESVYNCYVTFDIEDSAYDAFFSGYIPDGMLVKVVKSGGFSYKVSMADEFVQGVTIRTMKDANVTIDGVQLTGASSQSNYEESSDIFENYTVAVLLSGNHNLVIEHEMYDTIETEIYVGEYERSFYYTEMDLKEETRNQIFTQTTEIFKSMCAASMSSKDFSAVSGNITSNADYYEDLVYDYNYFKNKIKNNDGVGYSSLNFTSFTDSTTNLGMNNNRYTCKVSYTYDNVYVYRDYRSATGYNQRSTTAAEGYISMTFEYVDGVWNLISINDYRI
ncbi:MAG: zinc ribbon domain-containing protein [Clostridia bacterium]|nr:zinc ribbon domain-containing protein [Clostridia bacterium]